MSRSFRAQVVFTCCLFLAAIPAAVAQTPTTTSDKSKLPEEKKGPATDATLKIFGVIQADFYAADAGTSGGEDSSFFIRRARLGARGTLTDRIDYRVMVALDGNNSNTLAGDIKTFDAYVDVALDDSMKLRVGQFKYTFDLEGRRSAAALPLITRARVSNVLAGRLGQTGAAFRDVGVEFLGGAGKWKYSLGVVNGNGINKRNNNDDMDHYLRASAEAVPGLSLGAGYFQGTSSIGGFESDEDILTADVIYEREDLAIMAAFYSASYSRTGGVDVDPEGFYAVGTYRVRPKVELALRYQEFEQNSRQPDQAFDSVDAGVTYYFAPKGRWGGLKTALNYMARSAEANTISTVWEERGAGIVGEAEDVFLARLQVLF